MSRTNIDIDDALIRNARKLTRLKPKRQIVDRALELLVRRGTRFETGVAVAVRTLRARAAVLVRLAEQSWRNPGTREFLMNELASLKCDLRSIEDLVKDVPD